MLMGMNVGVSSGGINFTNREWDSYQIESSGIPYSIYFISKILEKIKSKQQIHLLCSYNGK